MTARRHAIRKHLQDWLKMKKKLSKLTKIDKTRTKMTKPTQIDKTDKTWQNSTHKNLHICYTQKFTTLKIWQNPHKLPAQQCDKNYSTFDIHVNRTTDEEITQEST